MDTSCFYQHHKTKRLFFVLAGLSGIAYLTLTFFLLRALFFESQQVEALHAESVAVFQGTAGQGMLVKITGQGFDEQVSAHLGYDGGNRAAIVASLPTWDHLNDVVIRGDKAYLANRSRGFQVVDIANSKRPEIIGSVDTPGAAWAVAVAGPYAYVADYRAGLQVVAIDDPLRPRVVANLPFAGRAVDVVVSGQRAFVAVRESGVKVISLAQPERPRLLKEIDVEGVVLGLALSDTRLFVANGKKGVLEYELGAATIDRPVRRLETSGPALGVTTTGTELFVGCGKAGLNIISQLDSANPPSVVIDTPSLARGVAVTHDRAYVADNHNGLQIVERHPVYGWRIGPTVDTPGSALNVAVASGQAYVVDGFGGLQIVELAHVDPWATMQRIAVPGYIRALVQQGDRIFVAAGRRGVYMLGCASDQAAEVITSIDTAGNAFDLAVRDDKVYVADGESGFQVLTVEDEGRLTAAHTVELAGVASAVTLVDSLAFVVAGKAGLYIVETDAEQGPLVIGHLGGLGYLRDIAIVGDYAYVAGKKGLQQVSIKDPTAPSLIGTVDLPLHLQVFARTLAVAVAQGKMMVANARAGCQVFDVSDPGQPKFLSTIASMGYVKGVSVYGGQAYLHDIKNGVRTVDLETLKRHRQVDSVMLTGLAVVGDRAFLAHGSGGVTIVPLPMELTEITVHSDQELSVLVPTPAMPGRYSLCLTKGEQGLTLSEPLKFGGAGEPRASSGL